MKLNVFKNYPQGFQGLFTAQTAFNFAFYGLKSIFILYVVSKHAFSEQDAINLFATLMTLSYGMSLLGGWIADKVLGPKTTMIWGGISQMVGMGFLLAAEKSFITLGLAFLSLGAGFIKPALASSVGMLFKDGQDPDKDKAYTTLYVAMNFGSFLGSLICGFLTKMFPGHSLSFFVIFLIFLIGTLTIVSRVKSRDLSPSNLHPLKRLNHPLFFAGFIFFVILILYFLFTYPSSFQYLMGVIATGNLFLFLYVFSKSSRMERKNLIFVILNILLFLFFCALFEQVGSSLLLFFDKAVDRTIMNFEVPSSSLLSLNPVFVLLLTPIILFIANTYFKNSKKLNGFLKMGIGFLFISLSFGILSLGCYFSAQSVPLPWIIGSLFIQTLGELLIVPIGFSNVSKFSPERYRTVTMSFWTMAIAYGHYLAGFIAQVSLTSSKLNEISLVHYQTFFSHLFFLPLLVAGLIFICHLLKLFGSLIYEKIRFNRLEEKV